MSDVPTRLLRETLRARLAADPAPDCLDTETLAAWSDGTLTVREHAAAESHASSCAQCQALLAAMARMTPEAPPQRWWRPSTFGWLAPLAAAAVAAVLWVNLPRGPAEQSVAVPPPASASTSVPDPTTASAVRALPGAAPVPDNRADEAKKAVPNAASPDLHRSAAATDSARPVSRRAESAKPVPSEARAAAPPAPPAVAPLIPPPAAPAPPQSTLREAAIPIASPVPQLAVEPKSLPAAGAISDQAGSRLRAQPLAKVASLPTEIVSPDANIRWRILTDGRVARSIDRGTKWQTQSTGVPVTLTAGTAPSPTICWLVGPGGSVILSTDGRTWQRLAFPEAIDLTSIRASDAANATVTAADGRTFVTTDGGRTWRAA